MTEVQDVYRDVIYATHAAYESMQQAIEAALDGGPAEGAIHSVQVLILLAIGDNEMSGKEIRTAVPQANQSYNVNALVSRGFVSWYTPERDQRMKLFKLTEKGQTARKLIERALREHMLIVTESDKRGAANLSTGLQSLRFLNRLWAGIANGQWVMPEASTSA